MRDFQKMGFFLAFIYNLGHEDRTSFLTQSHYQDKLEKSQSVHNHRVCSVGKVHAEHRETHKMYDADWPLHRVEHFIILEKEMRTNV